MVWSYLVILTHNNLDHLAVCCVMFNIKGSQFAIVQLCSNWLDNRCSYFCRRKTRLNPLFSEAQGTHAD